MFGKIRLTTNSLSSLLLDTSNPRLIGYRKQGKLNTEKDIISVMLSNYGIKDLISSILTNGYHPDEVLFSIPSDANSNKKIIVEGNRRLTACKIIKNPDLLKGTKYSSLIHKIKNHKNYQRAVDTIKKLNIIELDNRSAARSYIASKHTKESIRRWSVYTQGAYYIDLLNEFKDINELRASINNIVSGSRIKGIILFSRITDKILELNTLTDEEKEAILADIDNVKVEAILRLVQRSDFKKSIGTISLNNSGGLIVKKISQTAFSYILAKMARDSHFSKTLSTRQEDDKKVSNYINELQAIAAKFGPADDCGDEEADEHIDIDWEDNDENNSDDLDIDGTTEDPTLSQNDAQNVQPSPIPLVKKRNSNSYLLNKKTSFTGSHTKMDDLIDEAKRLNFVRFKHSAILLSRTLIQITLMHLIKQSEYNDEYKSKAQYRYLELDSLLDFFIPNLTKLFPHEQDPKILKLIRQDLSSYKESGKIIANLTTHSDLHILTDQEITHIQAKLQTLIDYFITKVHSGH